MRMPCRLPHFVSGSKQNPNAATLEKLELARAEIIAQHKQRMEQLMEKQSEVNKERHHLEQSLRDKLANLETRTAEIMRKQAANQPLNPGAGHMRDGGDKLDQILERLGRLEKRLDRLERAKQ